MRRIVTPREEDVRRRLTYLSPFFLLLFAATSAIAAQDPKAAEANVREQLRVGLLGVTAASKQTSPSRKLALADRALVNLRRARALQQLHLGAAHKALRHATETGVIRALNLKTRVYLERGSLQHAKRLNDAALSFSTCNVEALKLRVDVQKALIVDIYEAIQGRRAIERLRARHEATGTPLRDRGLARRR